jgi:hypothetical protein
MDSAMTLQEAKSIGRHLGLTLRQVRSPALSNGGSKVIVARSPMENFI